MTKSRPGAAASGRVSEAMLASLRTNRFLVLGRAGMDLYADPPGEQVEHATRFTSALGGSAANIAAGIVKLGGAAALVTTLSDDAVGRFVLNELDRYGVDRTHVGLVRGEMRTSLAVVETRLQNCQSVIYRNGAADFQLSTADVASIDLSTYGALIVTGTALAAEPSRSATLLAIGRAKTQSLPVIFDADYRPYSWPSAREAGEMTLHVAQGSSLVIANDVEFDVMAGGTGGSDLARGLAASVPAVIYKMGERGSITFEGAQAFTTEVDEVTALKPTGAGDAFLAGLVTGLAAGLDLRTSVRRGTAAAAIVVTRVGCAPACPTAQELDDFIQHRTPPRP